MLIEHPDIQPMKKNINSCRLTAALLFISLASLGQSNELDGFLRSQMRDLRIPGMAVAVVHHGKIVFDRQYDIANIQDSVPVTSKTIFAINSCTKAFTVSL